MIRPRASLALLLLALPITAPAAPPPPPRVAIETSLGRIVVEMATKQAPITSANFLRYVDEKRLDGTTFYRAARAKGAPKMGFVQGGIRHSYTRMLPPIAHEPTSKTHLRHVDGTISMARDAPGSATGDFFIIVGPGASLDAKGSDPGYAAFGHIVSGMDVVRRILAGKTVVQTGVGATKGQMLVKQIPITSAHRVR